MTTWLSRQLRLSMWWAWSPGLHIGEQLLHLFLTFLVVWGGGGGRREEEGGEGRGSSTQVASAPANSLTWGWGMRYSGLVAKTLVG